MVDLKDLKSNFPIEEKKVNVDSWKGEVKIKRLTLEETSRYYQIQKNEGSISGMIQAVSDCLVEPKISVEELKSLNESSFKGVEEIFGFLMEFSNEKK
ncbi:hypothetical protein [Arcobacter arenosus]|uniref:Phage tail assembly protein n=1 Tax=Arcobacter arenosus TaxID=2576037 RepID=A0A5R8Y4H7_9BACT|nr:hypothetical protein [Arcobacter arenosus]TLP41037.1 hypothetical protein FDK22_03185 [Arcobacter arenosus]